MVWVRRMEVDFLRPAAGDLTGLLNGFPRHALQSERRRGKYLIYMADREGHISIERVADLLNLRRGAIRQVPSRKDFSIDLEALETMIRRAALGEITPSAICAR